MVEFKRLTNDELSDFLQRAAVQLCPELTQQLLSIGLELVQYREKIENETLIDTTKEYYFITNNVKPTIVKSPLILGFNRMQGIVRYVDNEPRCICTNEIEAQAKLKELQKEA